MNTVHIINAKGQIEQVNYKELVRQFVDVTTTPSGVAPRLHVREETWFKVGGNLFAEKSEAEDAVREAEDAVSEIEEITRFEGWTWGHQGNFPRKIQVFNTLEEAEEWLFQCAEIDFKNDCNAPLTFNTEAEAEEWLKTSI